MKSFFVNIDILGSCNLRCPSCPVGNTKDYKLPSGFMSVELLGKILDKAASEFKITGVGLFNWTEPVLHPKLPEMIRAVQDRGFQCHLSSNLNNFKHLEEVMAANPYSLRISASGFTQEVYGRTHRGGDIEKVKAMMVSLAEARKKTNSTTRLHVLFHRYKHNLKEEPLMQAFAESLGIGFEPVWAFIMPVEKVLAFAEKSSDLTTLTAEDQSLIDNLALPLDGALEAARKYKESPCALQDEQVTIDFKGDVQVCCATYDERKFNIGNFLETPNEELQKRKYEHSICTRCMAQGAHVYFTYGAPELDKVALNNLPPEDAERLDLKGEIRRKARKRKLEAIYNQTVGTVVSPNKADGIRDAVKWLVNKI